MSDRDLKQIWKNATVSANMSQKMDKTSMHRFRKETSDRVFGKIKKGFIVDIVLKGLILGMIIIYMVIEKFNAASWSKDPSSMFVVSFISGFLLSAMVISAIISIRQFNKIPVDLPVLDSLEQKLSYVKTTYRKFMFGSALTAPLFVFVGNIIYFHRKYGEINYNDPVLFIFLFIAFIISYFAQIPAYNLMKRELEQAIAELDETKAGELEKARKKQQRQYIIWALLGLLLFIVLFVLIEFI